MLMSSKLHFPTCRELAGKEIWVKGMTATETAMVHGRTSEEMIFFPFYEREWSTGKFH